MLDISPSVTVSPLLLWGRQDFTLTRHRSASTFSAAAPERAWTASPSAGLALEERGAHTLTAEAASGAATPYRRGTPRQIVAAPSLLNRPSGRVTTASRLQFRIQDFHLVGLVAYPRASFPFAWFGPARRPHSTSDSPKGETSCPSFRAVTVRIFSPACGPASRCLSRLSRAARFPVQSALGRQQTTPGWHLSFPLRQPSVASGLGGHSYQSSLFSEAREAGLKWRRGFSSSLSAGAMTAESMSS